MYCKPRLLPLFVKIYLGLEQEREEIEESIIPIKLLGPSKNGLLCGAIKQSATLTEDTFHCPMERLWMKYTSSTRFLLGEDFV